MRKDIIRNVHGIEDYDGELIFCDSCGCEIYGEVVITPDGELCIDCAHARINYDEENNQQDE